MGTWAGTVALPISATVLLSGQGVGQGKVAFGFLGLPLPKQSLCPREQAGAWVIKAARLYPSVAELELPTCAWRWG